MAQPIPRQLIGPPSVIDQMVPDRMKGKPKQFYSYQAVFLGTSVLAAGASVSVNVAIDNDSDFLVTGINMTATDTTQLIVLPFLPALIQLQYTGSGATFFQVPDHVMNVVGDGALPGTTPWPFVIPGGASLQVTLTNLDAVNARVVRLSFPGMKIYRRG